MKCGSNTTPSVLDTSHETVPTDWALSKELIVCTVILSGTGFDPVGFGSAIFPRAHGDQLDTSKTGFEPERALTCRKMDATSRMSPIEWLAVRLCL